MSRKRLHQRFPRIVSSHPQRSQRARWSFERLESRLLLSADLVPAEEVLEIRGTETDDSVLIQTIEPEDGGTPQLLVTLNGQSFTHTLEPGQTVRVDLLDGNDVLDARITVHADWDLMLGEGNDRTNIETLIGDSFADAHYRVDAGAGDNETVIRFGDGQHGRRLPVGETNIVAEYRSGNGNDSVTFDWLVHLDRPLVIDVDADTGAGNDQIIDEWEHQFEFRTGKAVQRDYNFEVGEGSDQVVLRVKPGEGIDALGAEVRVSSDPEDRNRVKIATAEADGRTLGEVEVSGTEKLRVETGSGDDRVQIDDLTGALRPIRIDVATGAGDDEFVYLPVGRFAQYLEESLGEGLQWAVFDGGEGDDRFAVATSDRAERIEISGERVDDIPDPVLRVTDAVTGLITLQASIVGAESIDLDSAGGDDRVTMNDDAGPLSGIAFGFELGDGDDIMEATLHSTLPENHVLQISSSGGDDVLAIDYKLFLADGTPVRGRVLDLDLATGEGDDTVDFRTEIIDATESGSESAAMLDVALDLGTGAASVQLVVIYSRSGFIAGHPAEEASQLFRYTLDLLVENPALEDHQDLYMNIWINQSEIPPTPADSVADVLAGISVGDAAADENSSCWIRVSQLSLGGSMVLSLDADTSRSAGSTLDLKVRGSDADDNVRARIKGFAFVEFSDEAFGGNDSIWIDIGAPVMSRVSLDAGDGNDEVSLHVHDGTSNTIFFAEAYGGGGDDRLDLVVSGEFAAIDVIADGGEGNDLVQVQSNVFAVWTTVGFFEVVGDGGDDVIDVEAFIAADASLDLTVDAGGGADAVLIDLTLPAVRPVDDARADRVRIDLGEGDNRLDLSILGGPPPDDGKPAEFRPAEFHLNDGSGSSVVNLVIDGMLTQITADLGDGNNVTNMNLIGQVPGLVFDLRGGLGDDLFDLTADINDNGQLEVYDYPGVYAARFDGVDKGGGKDVVRTDWLDTLTSLDFDLDVRLGQAPSPQTEAGDEVAIAFKHGDAAESVSIGVLWNSTDKPPESGGEAPPRELHLGVEDGDTALPAVQTTLRGWDYEDKDEVALEFAGAFADLEVMAALGNGDDVIDIDAGSALFFPDPETDVSNIFIDLGGGDDQATMKLPGVQKWPDLVLKSTIDGGDGFDRLDLSTGDADDLLRIDSLASEPGVQIGVHNADNPGGTGWAFVILPYIEQDNIYTHGGADQIVVDLMQTPEPLPELRLETGDGDDTVRYRSFAIVDRTKLSILTGGGNDTVALEIDTTGDAAGVTPHFEIGVDAGLGSDQVDIDAAGVFEEFDLGVDLGADPTAGDVRTEKVTLTVEHIKREYHVSTLHEYAALGGEAGEGASAKYSFSFQSDEESVQSIYTATTIAGRVSDSVDTHVGLNETVTVGAAVDVTISDQTETVDRNETITVHSNRTETVGSEILVNIHGVDNLSAESTVRINVSGGGERPSGLLTIFEDNKRTADGDAIGKIGIVTGGQDDLIHVALPSDLPVRASFSEVSGLTSETSVAEYRAGVEVGEHVTLAIDLAGLEMVSVETGSGADEIVVDLNHPPAPVPALMFRTGNGDDTIDASSVYLPSRLVLHVNTGYGNDRVDVDVFESSDVVTGAGSGVPHVKAFTGTTSAETQSFFAYDPAFTGGVRVATGDVNSDGVADIITAAGPGAGPHVKVFDGRTGAEVRSFFAYDPAFTGGVFVAAGDVNGDGVADIITGAGVGAGPHVRVFDGITGAEIRSFFAYDPAFTGGVRVAGGDVNGDGFDDIITGTGPGAGPHVRVFDGITGAEIRSFFAYHPAFTGGVFVAAGDVNGDGLDDIVTGADAGGPAHVKVLSGATGETLRSFFAYDVSFTGGVRVAAGDVNGDGFDDIITGAGPGAGPHVRVFDGTSGAMLRSFFTYDPAFRGGVYVASGDIDRAEPEPPVFDLALEMGAGDDHAGLTFLTGRSRTDTINVDMGTGADSVFLDWHGALQDPAVELRAAVEINLGGADPAFASAGDQVQVTFMNGDPDRPIIIGRVWNAADSGESDDKSLQVEISSVAGILDVSSQLEGGSGNDSLRLFFQGKLRVGGGTQSAPPVRELIEMAGGNDQVQIEFSELEVEGLGNQAPIALDVRGGAGNDALSVTGTDGADRFAVNESMVVLEGVAAVGYAGFEFLLVETLAGNDTVTMTGIDPNTRTTIDGGAGRDRFIGRFASGFAGDLTLLNFEQASIKLRDGAETAIVGGDLMLGPVAVRLVSERDEGDNFLMV